MSGRGPRKQQLAGQTVVVLGGTSGIGLDTARLAREEGADVILTARDPDRLHRIGLELDASISAFDLSDAHRLMRFFTNLPGRVDHVLLSGGGPRYVPFAELDVGKIRSGALSGSCCPSRSPIWRRTRCSPLEALLLKIGAPGGRRPSAREPLISAVTPPPCLRWRGALPTSSPRSASRDRTGIRRHPLSAALLGDGLDARREQLGAALPIRRIVAPRTSPP